MKAYQAFSVAMALAQTHYLPLVVNLRVLRLPELKSGESPCHGKATKSRGEAVIAASEGRSNVRKRNPLARIALRWA
jgi:hypothetical protein